MGGSGEYKSLGAELGRLSRRSEVGCGLGGPKRLRKGWHISETSRFLCRFMAHFLEYVSLYCFLLCDFGRGDGLGFAGIDFRLQWSLGGPLLYSFRKQVFRKVSYKTSFPILRDSTPLLLVSVSVSSGG